MTVSELALYIGAQGTIVIDKLHVQVKIIDAKTSYGQDRFLVTPIYGKGEQWVVADRVALKV